MEKTTANGGCPSFERFAAFADKYIDGGLTEKEVGELFAHAEHCAECRRYLEMTVKAEEALGMPESVPMPSELHKKIMSSVTKPKSGTAHRARRLLPIAAVLICVFIATAAFFTLAFFNGNKGEAFDRAPAENATADDALTDGEANEAPMPDIDAPNAPVSTPSEQTQNGSDAVLESGISLDEHTVTAVIFALCAVFAAASVAALAAFLIKTKK